MKIALLLNGCGNKDGSEIHESVFAMQTLEKYGAKITCISLNKTQAQVTNHLDGSITLNTSRNMLQESARLARGKITDLLAVDPCDFKALVIPGGFGSALNLCTYGQKGPLMEVDPDVANFILQMYEQQKPIGAICIAPVIVAKVLGSKGVLVTIGNDSTVASHIESFGAKHQICSKGNFVTDLKNKIVTTPAYMFDDSTMTEVLLGIDGMVKMLLEMI